MKLAIPLRFAFAPLFAVAAAVCAAPPAPSGLVAFAGGDSIALRWQSSVGATSYRVYRDGTLIGTVTPGFHALFPEKDGNGIIDAGAVPGHTYQYRVQAMGGGASPMSAPLTVGFPAATTPPPTITLDYTQATDLGPWLQNTVRPFVQTWYPKVADHLAYPDYQAPGTFVIRMDPDYDGVAYANSGGIVVSVDYARANPQDLGMFLHEATHVVQQHARGGWITEGMADWVREYMLHDRDPLAWPYGHTFFSGYADAALMFDWIEARHAGFMRALNQDKHAGTQADTDPDTVFRGLAGITAPQAWFQMTGVDAGARLGFKGMARRCMAGPLGGIAGPAVIHECDWDAAAQQWVFERQGSGFILHLDSSCLDVVSSGTANGSSVQLWWDCNGTGAQIWRLQADGTLLNPQSGRCLYAPSTSVGTELQIRDCASNANQVLAPRPGEPLRFVGLAGRCVGSPGGEPFGGAAQVVACDITSSDQMWRVHGNDDATMALMLASGECLDVQGSGTGNGARVQLWGCNGSGAQAWRLRADGTLLNPQSGRCLDAGTGSVGAELRLWTCTAAAAQRFRLPDIIHIDGFE